MIDKNTEYLTTKEAILLLKVTANTLRRWDKENKITSIRMPSGIRRYSKNDIYRILKMKNIEVITVKEKIAYCRVYSTDSYEKIEAQRKYFSKYFSEHRIVEDVSDSISLDRKGLLEILSKSKNKEIEEIVILHQDILGQANFPFIEWMLLDNDTKIINIDDNKYKTTQLELATDISMLLIKQHNKHINNSSYQSYKEDKIVNDINSCKKCVNTSIGINDTIDINDDDIDDDIIDIKLKIDPFDDIINNENSIELLSDRIDNIKI